MNISFKEKDPAAVIKKIEGAMGGRKLADMVSFELNGSLLRIVISKLGKSFLDFNVKQDAAGTNFMLTSEKIAMTHKAFKSEVTEKIVKVIEQAGGKVVV